MLIKRNLCSISSIVIKENYLLDIQMVQMKEKQYETFTANVVVVSTPRLRHGEKEYIEIKLKNLVIS